MQKQLDFGMPGAIRVICGPARAGKTECLLARYRTVLAGRGFGRALWMCAAAGVSMFLTVIP